MAENNSNSSAMGANPFGGSYPFDGEEFAVPVYDDYLVKDADNNFYLSSDENPGGDDTHLYDSDNPTGGADIPSDIASDEGTFQPGEFSFGNNPFASSDSEKKASDEEVPQSSEASSGGNPILEGNEISVPAYGENLVNDEQGNWYLSSDDSPSDDDTQLYDSDSPMSAGEIPSFVQTEILA